MGAEPRGTVTTASRGDEGALAPVAAGDAEIGGRHGSGRLAGLALCVASIASPPLIAAAIQLRESFSSDRSFELSAQSIGMLCGVFTGFYVGVRRGRLLDLILGIPIGAAAGFVDLHSLEWAVRATGMPVAWAVYIPVWGALIGAWAGLGRRPAALFSVTAAVAVADGLARATWFAALQYLSSIAASTLRAPTFPHDWVWVIGTITYSVPSFVAVLLARRIRVRRE
jgi:hypothetical protein